jgi:spore coat protein A
MPMIRWRGLALIALMAVPALAAANQQVLQTPLPGASIPKYVEEVPQPQRVKSPLVTVAMEEGKSQILPPSLYPASGPFAGGTVVWQYRVNGEASYPGSTLEQHRGLSSFVRYVNRIVGPFSTGRPRSPGAPILQKYLTVDQTLHWADPNHLMCMFRMVTCSPQSSDPCCKPYGYPTWPGFPVSYGSLPDEGAPQPGVVHLHGGEVPSEFDGHPEAWFTPDGEKGPAYASLFPVHDGQAVYWYPNSQEAATLWYHDHTLGETRLNVFAGLAGFYLLRDDRDTGREDNPIHLPAGPRERELVIQDRSFDTEGQWFFPDQGVNPDVHPFWIPEFFGDVIVVNGKSWPFMQVEQRRYRLRLLNGSNARFYRMTVSDGHPFWQIGTDGGFLDAPVRVETLLLAPGERADVIVDFAGASPGTQITLLNDAPAPFPDGTPVDQATTAQIMAFRVVAATEADATCDPSLPPADPAACHLRADPIVRLAGADERRQLVLREVMSAIDEPLEVLLNNTKWGGIKESTLMSPTPEPVSDSVRVNDYYVTERPQVGATEVWEVANLTMDAHPIHLHLIQFQIVNRQAFDSDTYLMQLDATVPPGDGPPLPYNRRNEDGAIGGNFAFSRYLTPGSSPVPPEPNEVGWKDTVVMPPGAVTRIIARWAPQDAKASKPGKNLFSFNPMSGPGYVWHCHILDHEDNEMMRPYVVERAPQVPPPMSECSSAGHSLLR